jgi:NADP-dependent aldehyde dehydrogenase
MAATPGIPTTAGRVLVTGGAGAVATMLRVRLAAAHRILRLVDLVPPEPAAPGEHVEIGTADVRDLDAMRSACAEVDAVVHLGGLPIENTWDRILDVNVHGTRQVLEAARLAGVPRVILASSNHAAGMHERGVEPLPDDVEARPDTYYGWSKVAMEALGRLYVDRYGMDVIALRIGSCFPTPVDERMLATWLSPDDAARLVEACLTVPAPGFRIVWGVSANTRSWWSRAGGEEIGFRPVDDAEAGAAQATASDPDDLRRVGGPFCRMPIGVPAG